MITQRAPLNLWHTDLDLALAERLVVTDSERAALEPLMQDITRLAVIARTDSILALEKARMQLEDRDLFIGLRMLVDGIETANVVAWVRNRIIFSDLRGVNLLRMLVIGTGLQGIANGCDAHFLSEFLRSYVVPRDNVK